MRPPAGGNRAEKLQGTGLWLVFFVFSGLLVGLFVFFGPMAGLFVSSGSCGRSFRSSAPLASASVVVA